MNLRASRTGGGRRDIPEMRNPPRLYTFIKPGSDAESFIP